MKRCIADVRVILFALLGSLSVTSADTRVAVLPVGDTAEKVAALVEADLSSAEDWQVVDRSRLDAQTTERALQLVAGDFRQRRESAERLSADLIVVIRGTGESVQIVATDARRGLRVGRGELDVDEKSTDRIRSLLNRARKRAGKDDLKLICIPGVIDRNLTRQFSHLSSAYTQLLWQTFDGDDSSLLVELAESEALAREQALGDQVGVVRQLPIMVRIEYRHENFERTSPVRFEWILSRSETELARHSSDAVAPAAEAEALVAQTRDLVAKITGDQPAPMPDAKQLYDQAQRSFRAGQCMDAYSQFEASLLVDPNQTTAYSDAVLALNLLFAAERDRLAKGPQKTSWELARAKVREDHALLIARQLVLLETYLIRQKLSYSEKLWRVIVPALGWSAPTDARAMFLRVMKYKHDASIKDATPHFLTHLTQDNDGWSDSTERIDYVARAAALWITTERYHISQAFADARVYESSPALEAALDRMFASGNPLARRASIEMRRRMLARAAAGPDGLGIDKYKTEPKWNVTEESAEFRVQLVDLGFRTHNGTSGVLKMGDGVDIFWATQFEGRGTVYRLKDEPRPVAVAEMLAGSTPVSDGSQVWFVQVRRDETQAVTATPITLLDPASGMLTEAAAKLPAGPMERCTLVPLGGGEICLLADFGEIGSGKRRNWIGVIRRVRDGGWETTVFHDVSGDDDTDDTRNDSLESTFVARDGVLVAGNATGDGRPTPLVVFRHPSGAVVVDPSAGSVRLLRLPANAGMWGLYWTACDGKLLWHNPIKQDGAPWGWHLYDVARERLLGVNSVAPAARLLISEDGVRCVYFQHVFYAKTPLDPFEEVPTYAVPVDKPGARYPRLDLFESNRFGLIGFHFDSFHVQHRDPKVASAKHEPQPDRAPAEEATVEVEKLDIGIGMNRVRSGFLKLQNKSDLVWGGTDEDTWLFVFSSDKKPPPGPRILKFSAPVFDGKRVWFIAQDKKDGETALSTLDPATGVATKVDLGGKVPADRLKSAAVFVIRPGEVLFNAQIGDAPARSFMAFVTLRNGGETDVALFHEGTLQAETTGAGGDQLGNNFFTRSGVILDGPAGADGRPTPTLLLPHKNERAYAIDLNTRKGRFIQLPRRATMYARRWIAVDGKLVWSDRFTGGLQQFDIVTQKHEFPNPGAPVGDYLVTETGVYVLSGNQLHHSKAIDAPFTALATRVNVGAGNIGDMPLVETHHWGLVGVNYSASQFKLLKPAPRTN